MKVTTDEAVDILRNSVPESYRRGINKATLVMVAESLESPEEMEIFKENFITFSSVLSGNTNYSLQQYIDAVKYVSFKLMGLKNIECYARTFPERMLRLRREGKSEKDITAYVSGYNTSQLITRLMAQSVIPIHILNQGAVQEAINAQLAIIHHSKNDLAVVKAADSLLNHCKPPVETKMSLDINTADKDALSALVEATRNLAKSQRTDVLNNTRTVRDVAEDPLFRPPVTVDHVD